MFRYKWTLLKKMKHCAQWVALQVRSSLVLSSLGAPGAGGIWGYAHDIVTPDKNLPKLAGEITIDELLGITKLATKESLS